MKPIGILAALIVGSASAQTSPPAFEAYAVTITTAGQQHDNRTTYGLGAVSQSMWESGNDPSTGTPYRVASEARTFIGEGVLRAYSAASYDPGYGSQTFTGVDLHDTLTFDSGRAGQSLMVTYRVQVTGGMSQWLDPGRSTRYDTASGFTSWQLIQGLNYQGTRMFTGALPNGDGTSTPYLYGDAPLGGGTSGFGWYEVTAEVRSGEAAPLGFDLRTTVVPPTIEGSVAGGGEVDVNIHWGGILSVTSAQGMVVPYALTAASGFDYTRSYAISAVPEPSGVAMLLLGVLALGALGWCRRRHEFLQAVTRAQSLTRREAVAHG